MASSSKKMKMAGVLKKSVDMTSTEGDANLKKPLGSRISDVLLKEAFGFLTLEEQETAEIVSGKWERLVNNIPQSKRPMRALRVLTQRHDICIHPKNSMAWTSAEKATDAERIVEVNWARRDGQLGLFYHINRWNSYSGAPSSYRVVARYNPPSDWLKKILCAGTFIAEWRVDSSPAATNKFMVELFTGEPCIGGIKNVCLGVQDFNIVPARLTDTFTLFGGRNVWVGSNLRRLTQLARQGSFEVTASLNRCCEFGVEPIVEYALAQNEGSTLQVNKAWCKPNTTLFTDDEWRLGVSIAVNSIIERFDSTKPNPVEVLFRRDPMKQDGLTKAFLLTSSASLVNEGEPALPPIHLHRDMVPKAVCEKYEANGLVLWVWTKEACVLVKRC